MVQGGLRILEKIAAHGLRQLFARGPRCAAADAPHCCGAPLRMLMNCARRRKAAMTPEQYVQDKAAASGSRFYYAFLFLPPPRRAAITAFYAFCREVDDVVDEVSDPGVAATKLAWWRQEVPGCLCRAAQPPGDEGADAAARPTSASSLRTCWR